jgi:hypothetical protein
MHGQRNIKRNVDVLEAKIPVAKWQFPVKTDMDWIQLICLVKPFYKAN